MGEPLRNGWLLDGSMHISHRMGRDNFICGP